MELESVICKWVKGFGFIRSPGRADTFVHSSAVRNRQSLAEGDRVRFQIRDTATGRREAFDVAPIEYEF